MLKKIFLLLFSLVLTTQIFAAQVSLDKNTNPQGYPIIRIINKTSDFLYCVVLYNNGYGYLDFYVNAYSAGDWYFEPRGMYTWSCKVVEVN